MSKLYGLLSRLISRSLISYFPVRVRAGLARNAKWTIAPFSSNWRHGGDGDVAAGFKYLALQRSIPGSCCWDFGAHFGIETVGMAMQVGPKGKVFAFEPDPVAFARLTYHVRRNQLAQVEAFNVAVSDGPGLLRLACHSHWGSAQSRVAHDGDIVIDCVAPDDMVAAGKLRLPDFIKVDIEGHGGNALKGSILSIRQSRPIIVFSIHSPHELAMARSVLEPSGYRRVSRSGSALDWADLSDPISIFLP
jgi:FkbM family methyltransferase